MKKCKVAYLGSPNFSADFLEKLLTIKSINRLIQVELVVTQPDRPVGRKQILMPTPVKEVAVKYKIPILEYKSKILNPKFQINQKSKNQNSKRLEHLNLENSNLFRVFGLEFRILKSVDLALVYAFAHKIPADLLNLPKYGFWNIHPSLLPKYRGPSPIAVPLINGDCETGVTIIKMDDQIDHGPIIAQEKLKILPTDKRPDLEKKLTKLAFNTFVKILMGVEEEGLPTARRLGGVIAGRALAGGNLIQDPSKFTQQDHSQATYTKLLKKSDGFIPFENLKFPTSSRLAGFRGTSQISNSPKQLYNLFRGLYPWPGLWTLVKIKNTEKRLKITQLALKNNKLIIKKIQLEGKKEVDFGTFNDYYRLI